MTDTSYVIKLVRDNLGEKLGEGRLVYEKVGLDEHVKLLRAKLIEEAIEYITDPSIEELGDVLEVVYALANVDLRISVGDLQDHSYKKFEERGGFTKGAVIVEKH